MLHRVRRSFASVCVASTLLLGGLFSNISAQDVEWEPYLETGGQMFPSFIIATQGVDFSEEEGPDPYFFGDDGGLLGVGLVNPKAGSKVAVEVSCEDLIKPSTVEATLPEEGGEYVLMPILMWDFKQLRATDQARPLVVSFKLSVDGKPAGTKQAKAFLRSVNDCPYYILDPESGEGLDTSWLFAAYVNEDHPWIDETLRAALDQGVVNAFTGYQSGDEEEVLSQVFAIWTTLREEGIQYSNITQAVGKNDQVRSQEVRFLDQSIGNAQANCVDGSVMMASFLRKIDIASELVMVPGHCYLAFYLDKEGNNLVGLETTMMGTPVENPEAVLAALPDDVEITEEMAADEGFLNFLSALMVGSNNLEEHAADFADPMNPDYELISLDEARGIGIMPIGHAE